MGLGPGGNHVKLFWKVYWDVIILTVRAKPCNCNTSKAPFMGFKGLEWSNNQHGRHFGQFLGFHEKFLKSPCQNSRYTPKKAINKDSKFLLGSSFKKIHWSNLRESRFQGFARIVVLSQTNNDFQKPLLGLVTIFFTVLANTSF